MDPLFTMEDSIGRMYGQLGVGWPNPWASPYFGNNPSINDCAMACSWADYGLQWNNAPYYSLVSALIQRSGQPNYEWAWGIGRGDNVGFLWSGSTQNVDHVEKALNSPDGAGNFLTIGTNAGPYDNMAIRTRNVAQVVMFSKPNYKKPSPAGGGGTPIYNTLEEEIMALTDGGYFAERNSKGDFVRGMIVGPGVPGGAIIANAAKDGIARLQAMGDLAGVRVFNEKGEGQKTGAPIKNVGTDEFNAIRLLSQEIWGKVSA